MLTVVVSGALSATRDLLRFGQFSQEIVQGITHTVGSYEISFEELVFDKGYPGAHNRLGIGGYGEVFLASWHGTPVAVKRLLEQVSNQWPV